MDVANHDWYRRALEAERERANAIAQLKYEQANRRKEDAKLAHERDDFIKELETVNTGMRTALEAIQEQHKPVKIMIGFTTAGAKLTEWVCKHCTEIADPGTYFSHPCLTRKLADQGLGGEQPE